MQTASSFYKSIFGSKTYKISLDAGCSCPTRDGSLSYGGCSFCGQRGSGDFTPEKSLSIPDQVEAARLLVDSKFRKSPRKYIAYFQSFTNTYGNLRLLEEKWRQALSCPGVVGLALGTRPDCISEECLKLLSTLCDQGYFVQVELGFQSSDEETAAFFNRAYKNDVYFDAVYRLHRANAKIHVVTHVLFGLPVKAGGIESPEQMLASVKAVCQAKSDGIKIANLYVLKNTPLEELYKKGAFRSLDFEEYMQLLQEALKILPPSMVIHRLSGDPPRALLLAPAWCSKKKVLVNAIKELLKAFD